MTALPHAEAPTFPPKEAMPPLDTRAPRPRVVRLRRSVVTVAVMGACGLLAGSLAWGFIVEPGIRARAMAHKVPADADAHGAVRPSELVTNQPATYAQLDKLPPPRGLGQAGTPASTSPPSPATGKPQPANAPHGPSPSTQARSSQLFFAKADGAVAGPTRASEPIEAGGSPGPATRDYAAVYNAHSLMAPLSPYELKAGAVVPAALLTAIDTSREGPVVATITDNIFDTVSGRILLIPQGARLLGRHEGESRYGDRRAFVTWDRLILPNGKSLVLSHEPGVDAQGAVGVQGQVDRRIGSLVVATLFAGAITSLGEVARDHQGRSTGLIGDAGDAAAIEGAEVGGRLIDRELQVKPQIHLQSGARVRVLITRDLVLEPYQR
jgi:type IV secretion system protein VirB10